MTTTINKALTQFGVLSAHPAAFAFVGFYALLWCLLSPATLEWHAGDSCGTVHDLIHPARHSSRHPGNPSEARRAT